ncbi:MAG TPA: spore coat protein U domain-containing protein, partial [Dyella sp.]|nr:spore coat protein U domain-containing protein [Dyella sp.]
MFQKKIALAVALISLGGFAIAASAATASSSFKVKLTINKACSVSTSGDLDFGSAAANSTGDLTQNTSNINVTCSKKTAYKIGLKPSSNSTDGTGTMAGATTGNTDTVAYALYQDVLNSTSWGNTAGTNTQDGTGN